MSQFEEAVLDVLSEIAREIKSVRDVIGDQKPGGGQQQQETRLRFSSTCPQGCGEKIAWVETVSGAWVALEDKPGPYSIIGGRAKWIGDVAQYAFHFASCSHSKDNQASEPDARPSAFEKLREQVAKNQIADATVGST